MQIQLIQPEIEAAVRAHIAALGFEGTVGDINFIASRGSSGMTAEIDIPAFNTAAPAPALAAVKEEKVQAKEASPAKAAEAKTEAAPSKEVAPDIQEEPAPASKKASLFN